jgi:hypothetical protein
MDHPLPAPDALIRPWRTATLVACAVAALELLLLIVLGGALVAKEAAAPSTRSKAKASRQATAASRAAPTKRPAVTHATPSRPPAAALARTKVRVLVLNGNGRHGAAGAAAERLERRGYRIGAVTNAGRMDYARSLVMYRSGFAGEAARLGRDLQIAIVGPLDGMRPAQLHGAHVVLIVGG